jgi:hypothetical protein
MLIDVAQNATLGGTKRILSNTLPDCTLLERLQACNCGVLMGVY